MWIARIRAGISTLQQYITDLEGLAKREITIAKREVAMSYVNSYSITTKFSPVFRRANRLGQECTDIQASYDAFKKAEQTKVIMLWISQS